jgi:hypothetical protein
MQDKKKQLRLILLDHSYDMNERQTNLVKSLLREKSLSTEQINSINDIISDYTKFAKSQYIKYQYWI